MKVKMVKITKKGQVIIPPEIRKKLQIKQNDVLAVSAEEDCILIRKVEVPEWKEMFSKGETIAKEKKITPEDILEACSDVRHGL